MHIFQEHQLRLSQVARPRDRLSWAVIIAGAFVFFTKGIPLGIEFAGGTSVIVKFDQDVSIQQVRSASTRASGRRW
jgi:preprotein translocase subunit SecF